MYNREEGKIGLCYLVPEGLGQGNGSRILEALETQARLDGKSDVFLTSTATAKNFYLLHGFELDGESFLMFGVLAHPMRKRLSE
jgi:predicted GNAT family N-acyltransferase